MYKTRLIRRSVRMRVVTPFNKNPSRGLSKFELKVQIFAVVQVRINVRQSGLHAIWEDTFSIVEWTRGHVL